MKKRITCFMSCLLVMLVGMQAQADETLDYQLVYGLNEEGAEWRSVPFVAGEGQYQDKLVAQNVEFVAPIYPTAPARSSLRSNDSPRHTFLSNLLLRQQLPIMNDGLL